MDNPLDSDEVAGAQPVPRPVQPAPAAPTPIAEQVAEQKPRATVKPRKKTNMAFVWVLASVLVAVFIGGVVFVMFAPNMSTKTAAVATTPAEAPQGPLAPFAKGTLAHLMTFAQPKAMDDMAFMNRDRKPMHLSDFKGQVVVLNLWATWCAPCRTEMPTLANLQAQYAGKGLKVIPLSGDNEDKMDDVKSFIDVQEPLEVYIDPTLIGKSQKLEIQGLPSTLIFDKQGREVARLDGQAAWDSPESKALMDKLLAE